MSAPLRILFEEGGLLAVEKPPGLPTTSPDGRGCLVERVRLLRPRAEVCHPSSRLDRDVTGVVVFATTSRAIEALLDARRHGRYRRLYVAIVSPAPDAPLAGAAPGEAIEFRWSWPIVVDPKRRSFRLALDPGARGERAQDAETEARVVARAGGAAMLHLEPRTGRTHQLRVHCAKAGCPIVGDVSYGGAARIVLSDGTVVGARRPLLHCARVRVPDARGGEHVIESPLPDDLRRTWQELGGAPDVGSTR